jgi:methyltransferase (TIGR00027 family)
MIENRPSLTAERVAIRRAAHQLLDTPCIFEDPLAFTILGETQTATLRADPTKLEGSPIASRLRAFLAIRSRLAEDALKQAVADGVRQYVVLGAGLDTFAYRNPYANLRVFEVDHPATQTWKRERLAEVHIPVPESVTFVPADFVQDQLPVILQAAGLHPHEPSYFSWLGVTPYLETTKVLSTLNAIAPLAENGGGVVFDYITSPELLGPRQRAGFEALAIRVAAAGEPFRGNFEPSALVAAMHDMGFRSVRDVGPDELNGTFFSNRADGMQVGGAGRILIAFG